MRELRRHWFFGGDSALSGSARACDAAYLIAFADDRRNPAVEADWQRPVDRSDFQFGFVAGRVLRGFGLVEWAALMHLLRESFPFDNMALDPGGGGLEIERNLAKPRQELPVEIRRSGHQDVVAATRVATVRPIVTWENLTVDGTPCLVMVKRGDRLVDRLYPDMTNDKKLVDHLHTDFHAGLAQGVIALPPGFTQWPAERHRGWPQERIEMLKVFETLQDQARHTTVEKHDDGTYVHYAGGSKNFLFAGRSDVLKAAVYCYAAFLTWVQARATGYIGDAGGGRGGCGGDFEVW